VNQRRSRVATVSAANIVGFPADWTSFFGIASPVREAPVMP
jgi:hypothetical protein